MSRGAVEAVVPDGAFRFSLRVEAAQLGSVIEHVSNIEYVRWVDLAHERCLDAAGLTRAGLLERRRMFFVGRHEIDYLAETFRGDVLEIATWTSRRGGASHDRMTTVHRREPEGTAPDAGTRGRTTTPVCTARSRWVFVDLDRRLPVRMPDDVRAALEPVENAEVRSVIDHPPRMSGRG